MRVQFNSIFCPTDLSDYSNQAILYGIALAKVFGAKLYVCHVVEAIPAIAYGEPFFDISYQQEIVEQNARKKINELMEKHSVNWEPVVSIGHVADEIVRTAGEKFIDIIIAATRTKKGLKRLLLGSVTERLIRIAPCPLFILRGSNYDSRIFAKRGFNLRRILVGCDFSEDSGFAVQHGLSLAQEFQAELNLVHVIDSNLYKYSDDMMIELKHKLDDDLRNKFNKKLIEMFPQEAYNWCNLKTILLAGRPHEELVKYAVLKNIDLIIMGTRGIGLVETMFIGSTTDRVIRKSSCPVLSVCKKIDHKEKK